MCYSGASQTRKCLNSLSFLTKIFDLYSENEEEIDLCDDSTLDAIFIMDDGSIYAFRGRHNVYVTCQRKKTNVSKYMSYL